jgi:hypothetical protein
VNVPEREERVPFTVGSDVRDAVDVADDLDRPLDTAYAARPVCRGKGPPQPPGDGGCGSDDQY